MRKTAVVPLVLFAAVLAGCGGDRAQDTEPRTAQTARPSDARVPDAADQAVAEAAVLRLADFPAGWTAEDADAAADEEESRLRVAACVGVDYEDLYISDSEAQADSRDFTSEGGDEIGNSVSITTDQERAAGIFAIVASPSYRECGLAEVKEGMKRLAAEEDVEVGEPSLEQLSFDRYGDDTTAFRITVPLEAEGMEVAVYIDFVAVRVGRAATTVRAQSTFSAFDTAELSAYVRIAVERLRDALGR